MYRQASVSILLLLVFILFSCKQHHGVASRSFYYWKTSFPISPYEIKRMHELNVQQLYVRLFDVDWDDHMRRAMPVAPLRTAKVDTAFQYIPVVFITQKTL